MGKIHDTVHGWVAWLFSQSIVDVVIVLGGLIALSVLAWIIGGIIGRVGKASTTPLGRPRSVELGHTPEHRERIFWRVVWLVVAAVVVVVAALAGL